MILLEAKEISHEYASRSLFRRMPPQPVLSGISVSVEQGRCLGLIGTSGAGKSTLGKVILGLEKPQRGKVLFQGIDLYGADAATRRRLRRDLQAVFQDCYSSVNPRMTAEQIISEPLLNFGKPTPSELKRSVGGLLERVGLRVEDMRKQPHQFSGGQLQRINIARAIALKPKLIVLDEAVSSLDMATQSHILQLLNELKTSYGLSYLFITHDIKAAYAISDAIAVMEHGRVVAYSADPGGLHRLKHPSVETLFGSMLAEHPRQRSVSGLHGDRR
ncbi:nickel import ATP-binding protein NikE [Gorillibacterium sp. sgz5001074]|uniref:nickel import ATP-binding protein NikE n=1 Tax=Gorillibacterium sp. sgz5001074 TaxID=3446695 RepID=UPI003F6742C2